MQLWVKKPPFTAPTPDELQKIFEFYGSGILPAPKQA